MTGPDVAADSRVGNAPDIYTPNPPDEQAVDGLMVQPPSITRRSAGLTRAFDLVVVAIAALPAALLACLIVPAIKLTSRGPATYGSPRFAQGAGTFKAWKFRTMFPDADERLEQLLANDAEANAEYEQHRKLTDDPRITRFGHILRRTSLDELPQLINIAKGEMSVVGPRPKLLNEDEIFGEALPYVLSVRPGLTGLWQTSGRNQLTMAERIELDVRYVNERTLLGDIRICAITAVQLLRPDRHGAI